MFTFLAFVSYIMNETNITYSEARIEAINRCELLLLRSYSNDVRVQSICSEVWVNNFPEAYDYE